MKDTNTEQSRLVELAVDAALGVLDGDDALEFAELLARHPQFDRSGIDQAVGASFVALNPGSEPLPERLVIEIARQANHYFSIDRPEPVITRAIETATPPPLRRRSWGSYTGWLAAAASLLLAIGLWTSDRDTSTATTAGIPRDRAVNGPAADGAIDSDTLGHTDLDGSADTDTPTVAADSRGAAGAVEDDDSAASRRANLIASSRFVLRRAWTNGPAAAGSTIEGDVVWDGTAQQGYLRFVGLRRNDPSFEQYQLWIFDASRDERFPVDGGVFDVNDAGEVVVPIRAQLRVRTPTLFAVTLEPPGGVVVSSRERIVALATIG